MFVNIAIFVRIANAKILIISDMQMNNFKKSDKIKLRILQFAKERKLIMGDFYEKISVHPSTFSGKGLESALSGTTISEILKIYPELSADWLLLEKGEMLRKNNLKNIAVASAPQSNASNGNLTVEAPAELLALLTSQQETIKSLTMTIDRLTSK